MTHMAHNAGGPASLPTTSSTMTQAVPPPALVYAATGYAEPPAYVPPATTATTATARRNRGRHEGFRAAPLTMGGTYTQRTANGTTTTNAHIQNDYRVFNNWNSVSLVVLTYHFSTPVQYAPWSAAYLAPRQGILKGRRLGRWHQTAHSTAQREEGAYLYTIL